LSFYAGEEDLNSKAKILKNILKFLKRSRVNVDLR
jgi:hypothetical protein